MFEERESRGSRDEARDAVSARRVGWAIFGALAVLVSFFVSFQVVERVDADQILVVQDVVDGDLHWYTSPGVKPQWFGKTTVYPKRYIYEFSKPDSEGETDTSLKLRFNDGGHADMTGSIQIEMPVDPENLSKLHTRFGSIEAIKRQLIEPVVTKSVYTAGPHMSSKESYAERRNQLISLIEDQIENGVFLTTTRDVKVKDPITGAEKTASVVEIARDPSSLKQLRVEEAQLTGFGIKPFNLSVSSLDYDNTVEAQIQQQQKLAMDVQTAIAEAKKSEQAAITAEQRGRAEATKAKWEQEVENAKLIAQAEQKLKVQTLAAQTAEQYKKEQTLMGEGEANRRRAVMSADGALEKKLDAYVKVNELWAGAIRDYKGNWVPGVVMGEGTKPGGGSTDLIEMLKAKTAKDLALDISARSGGNK